MQQISETLAQVSNPESQRLQTLLESTQNISDYDLRLRILAKILFDDRTAHQYEPRKPEDTDKIAQTLIPITRSIPVEQLYPSYVTALEMRQPGNNYQISGIELLQGWKELQGSLEMESISGHKLLAENAAAACQRCFGKGQDITPDGSKPCDHTPLTEDEIKERAQAKADGIRWMRQEAEKLRAAKRAVETPKVEPPKGQKLVCDACGHKGNTLEGWTIGEGCTVKDCGGRMR